MATWFLLLTASCSVVLFSTTVVDEYIWQWLILWSWIATVLYTAHAPLLISHHLDSQEEQKLLYLQGNEGSEWTYLTF